VQYEIQKYYQGLEYVTVAFKTTPSKHGTVVPARTVKKVDLSICKVLLRKRVPLRGIEVRFLRKTLGLSLTAFAEMSSPRTDLAP
jgi:DNA-binding transcriptional regulator YiaG